jgi:hypothetical protein
MRQIATPEPQFQPPSVIPFPEKTGSDDPFEDDLHQAAMGAAQAKLFFCRARRTARNAEASRVLGRLIDGQEQAIASVQRLRTGGEKAL